jgi:chaperonin GroES
VIPVGDRVIVKTQPQGEYTTESGLYVADDDAKEVIGTVIACPPESDVKPDDVVVFSPLAGRFFEYEGERYLALKADDILAVWE